MSNQNENTSFSLLIGYSTQLENFRNTHCPELIPARVFAVNRENYLLYSATGLVKGEITGKMRFSSTSPEDLPATGDWVFCTPYNDDELLIHSVAPRVSLLKRKSVGRSTQTQVICANLDKAMIVISANQKININRIERYLTIGNEADIPVELVLTHIDLITEDEKEGILEQIKKRHPRLTVHSVSNQTLEGVQTFLLVLLPDHTYALLGNSGAGKSSLINSLTEKDISSTRAASTQHHKGKHTTTRREIYLLDNRSCILDNPGMRELGLTDDSDGLATTFDQISALADSCKFRDCQHIQEKGCAVKKAVQQHELSAAVYDHYLKLWKEQQYFEESSLERKRKSKHLSKVIRDMHKKQ